MGFFTEPLKKIDRFGDPDPKPKRTFTGLVTIAVYIFLVAYAVQTTIQYEHEPALQENHVLWSAYSGPYPLTLACAAERCWASMSLLGAYGPCLSDVPDDQADSCLEMAHGETVTLKSCYALLPSQGVRLYFSGSTAEQWNSLAPATGMGDASDAEHFGFYSVSDMLRPDQSVMQTKTPLREGLTMMTYVHTKNNSVAEGEAGNDRHEWFSQILDQNPSSEPNNAPCAAQVGASASTVRTSVLRMAPDFTKIEVTPNPPYWAALFGEVGGALAACDELLGVAVLLIANVAMLYWSRADKAREASDKPAKGDATSVAVAAALPAEMEERLRQMVAEATSDLTRRLAEAEAALQKMRGTQSPAGGAGDQEQKLQAPKAADGAAPLSLQVLDRRLKIVEGSAALENTCDGAAAGVDLGGLDKRLRIIEETLESGVAHQQPSRVRGDLVAFPAVVDLGPSGPTEVVPKEPRGCGGMGCA